MTIETLLEIENKDRELVPMKFNSIQERMISDSTGRDIYVKPGQVGATSVHVADFYIDNITINGTVSVIVSYDEFSAKRLIMKAKKYHNNLARRWPTIPKLDHKGAEELTWEIKDDKGRTVFYSVMYIFSARSYTIGRGETIHNLLLDEYAFWPEGTHESVFASAVQRVPLKKGTKIRIQSTANGEEDFYEMYKAAVEGVNIGTGRIKSVYKPHFYPWFDHEEYRMKPDDPFVLDGDDVDELLNLQPEEENLLTKLIADFGFNYDGAMDALRWRRYKKAEMASQRRSGDTMLLFEQEYPEDDETCFIIAGNLAYSSDIVNSKISLSYPAPKHISVTNKKTGVSIEVDIWFDREDGLGYLLSIDPGKGKVSESVAHVWHFEDGYKDKDGNEVPPVLRHCATMSGWYDEYEFAEYCKELGYYYNGAVICPEDNLDIVSHLRGYANLYYREDVRSGKMIRAIGWQTNTSTKPYMLTELNKYLEDIECYDRRFWSQLKNIRRDPTVKYGISVIGADDHHDAGAIAVVCKDAQMQVVGHVWSTSDPEAGGWSDDWGR
jgi:hypothetical protein